MKKISVLAASTVIVFSACKFQLPEKVSVKAKSDYAFSLGDFSRKLSDYVSAEDLDRQMNAENTSQSKFNVYDYNPDESSAQQQFLIDFKLKEIPIDVGSYLKHMDFSTQLKNMSFEKKIKIPAMKKSIVNPIALPDVNAKIRDTAQFAIPDFPLAEGVNGTIPETSRNIMITSPQFSTMECPYDKAKDNASIVRFFYQSYGCIKNFWRTDDFFCVRRKSGKYRRDES